MSAIIDALSRRSSDTLARLPEIRLALTHARERVQTAALEQALLVAALDQALLVIELAEHLRGAMAAQNEREQLAGERCGVSAKEAGCDWPDEVADVVIGLRERIVSGVAGLPAEPRIELVPARPLAPCPFCGPSSHPSSGPQIESIQRDGYDDCPEDEDARAYYVTCPGCAMDGPWGKSLGSAVLRWNLRPGLRVAADRTVVASAEQ